MTTKPKPRIAPNAVYAMRLQGAVLMALERTLFVRNDGAFAQCQAVVRNGEAHLSWRLLDQRGWRARLALRLLGLRR